VADSCEHVNEPEEAGNLLSSGVIISFSKMTLSHAVGTSLSVTYTKIVY
jgi:hypothetical protein